MAYLIDALNRKILLQLQEDASQSLDKSHGKSTRPRRQCCGFEEKKTRALPLG